MSQYSYARKLVSSRPDDSSTYSDYEQHEYSYGDEFKKLAAPIYLDLADNGGQVRFRTFADAVSWAEEELDAWRYIAVSASPADQRVAFVADIVTQQLGAGENIADAARAAIRGQIDDEEATAAIRRFLDAYVSFNCVHSRSVLGQMAITMERYRPMVLGMLAGATGSTPPESGRAFGKPSDAEAFTFGYALAIQFRSSARPETLASRLSDADRRVDTLGRRLKPTEDAIKRLDEEQTALVRQMENAKSGLEGQSRSLKKLTEKISEETTSRLEDAIAQMWDRLDNMQGEFESRLENLSAALATRMQGRASVDYWAEEVKMHEGKSSQSLAWFVITGLLSLTGFLAIAFGLQRSGMLANIWSPVPVAALGLPLLMAVILLVLLAKSYSSHEKLGQKARERIAMIETFAALEAEGHASADERSIILNALFANRPAQNSGERRTSRHNQQY